jgi:hypothetical protein
MPSRISVVSLVTVAALGVLPASAARAQIRRAAPTGQIPGAGAIRKTPNLASSASTVPYQIVIAPNCAKTVLSNITNGTGSSSTPLPTSTQVSTAAATGQSFGAGFVTVQFPAGGPAAKYLANMPACNTPNCIFELDQLSLTGQIVLRYLLQFPALTAYQAQSSPGLGNATLSYRRLVARMPTGGTSHVDDWHQPQ